MSTTSGRPIRLQMRSPTKSWSPVRVLPAFVIAVLVLATRSAFAADVIVLDPEPNEGLTNGVFQTYTDADGPFQANVYFGDRNLVSIGFIGPAHAWFVSIGSPLGTLLEPKYYDDASTTDTSAPSLSVGGDGRGCSSVGRFVVFELVLGPSGTLERFAADFEQRCNAAGPALFGAVRFHSDIPISRPCNQPDGDRDGHDDLHDRCQGTPPGELVDESGCAVAEFCSSIDASSTTGRRACRAVDWRNDGQGRRRRSRDCVISRDSSGLASCVARDPASRPWATLEVGGDPGNSMTGDQQYRFTSADGYFSGSRYFVGNLLQFGFSGVQDGEAHNWSLTIGAPNGALLAPGRYDDAVGFPPGDTPLLSIIGGGQLCSPGPGSSFVIDELVHGPYHTIDRVAVSFAAYCGPGQAVFRGSLSIVRRRLHGLTCLDGDADGEPDRTDVCPETPSGEGIDQAGCSRPQFCGAIDPAMVRASVCGRADWRGDSPRRRPLDCQVVAGTCVARADTVPDTTTTIVTTSTTTSTSLASTTSTTTSSSTSTTVPACAFVLEFGVGPGMAPGELESPSAVATDAVGNVYVADLGNNRVQKFAASGAFITAWGGAGTGNGRFNQPVGIAIGAGGDVYVADFMNHRIQQFDSSGAFLSAWGTPGSGPGQFRYPTGIATDSIGDVYVTDQANQRVQKFDASGMFLTTWGSSGTDDGQFHDPRGVAVDANGNVYVADTRNHRVQKFDGSGAFLRAWGVEGTASGEFENPVWVAIDASGSVYVTDYNNSRVQKFDGDGGFLTSWGSFGGSNGQFRGPSGIATHAGIDVYVVDFDNDRIQRFSTTGDFVSAWGDSRGGAGEFAGPAGVASDASGIYVTDYYYHRVQKFDAAGTFLTTWGTFGNGPGQFAYPYGIATDGSGHVYVSDTANARVQKFDADGGFITAWGSAGSGPGQFSTPTGVAVGASGDVYVADFSPRIQKFDADGGFLTAWGSSGSGPGQFSGPGGVTIDGDGNVYVADTGNHRVQRFDATGGFLGTWGGLGPGIGQFSSPYGITTDANGGVYVSDYGNGRVQKFDAAGTFLLTWGANGSAPGLFTVPRGITVDPAGDTYVADHGNNRIQKFSCP